MAQPSSSDSYNHSDLYKQIGHRIRQARKVAELTQEKLGARVNLTRTSVTNIEKGRQKLLVHTLAEIARELDVPVAKLLPDTQLQKRINAELPKDMPFRERDFFASIIGYSKDKVIYVSPKKTYKKFS